VRTRALALALALAIGLATAVSPVASSAPDGLNRVAADHGFAGRATTHRVQERAPAAGYAFPGIGDQHLAKGVSGFVGTLGVFALGWGLALALRRRRGGGRGPAGPQVAA
jgi:hypothetical protein